MDDWLAELGSGRRALDLGAGSGSFDCSRYSCSVVALDIELDPLKCSGAALRVKAQSERLPFSDRCFDMVICHNSLEHFAKLESALEEIARVLKPGGRLYVSIPHGYGFDDNLYRLLGGARHHVNRFRFSEAVARIENKIGVRLVKWRKLYSSFTYLRKPPAGVPLPRRLKPIALLPASAFALAQLLLNAATRLADQLLGTDLAVYGWALYFVRSTGGISREPIEEPAYLNVCRHCGAGHPASSLDLRRRWRLLYDCPSCGSTNLYFEPFGNTL